MLLHGDRLAAMLLHAYSSSDPRCYCMNPAMLLLAYHTVRSPQCYCVESLGPRCYCLHTVPLTRDVTARIQSRSPQCYCIAWAPSGPDVTAWGPSTAVLLHAYSPSDPRCCCMNPAMLLLADRPSLWPRCYCMHTVPLTRDVTASSPSPGRRCYYKYRYIIVNGQSATEVLSGRESCIVT